MAAACDDGAGTISLWNTTDPTHPGRSLKAGHRVNSLAFSPDGRTLAAGSSDSKVHLWNATDPNHLTRRGSPLTVPGGSLWSVAFGPDGHTLAATTDDGMATLWDLNVESAISRICAGSNGALSRQQWSRYVTQLPYEPTCVTTQHSSRRG
ncbi:WD40 repeat domain-containing protein [Streptomyces sp. NPDC101194]|uniref:WD40 repeat domain-containing protein n=1 Tax=Streptomyces sp. NPDC101194 TaxID=3366127 RepID=UPI00382DC439